MANYPQERAQDAVCQSHTDHMTGLWFLPTRPLRLNTNEWMNEWMNEWCVLHINFKIESLIDFPPNIRTQSGRLSLRRIARVRSIDGAAICTLRAENGFYSCTTPALTRESVKWSMNTGLTVKWAQIFEETEISYVQLRIPPPLLFYWPYLK